MQKNNNQGYFLFFCIVPVVPISNNKKKTLTIIEVRNGKRWRLSGSLKILRKPRGQLLIKILKFTSSVTAGGFFFFFSLSFVSHLFKNQMLGYPSVSACSCSRGKVGQISQRMKPCQPPRLKSVFEETLVTNNTSLTQCRARIKSPGNGSVRKIQQVTNQNQPASGMMVPADDTFTLTRWGYLSTVAC